jgi:hypothetical protein
MAVMTIFDGHFVGQDAFGDVEEVGKLLAPVALAVLDGHGHVLHRDALIDGACQVFEELFLGRHVALVSQSAPGAGLRL